MRFILGAKPDDHAHLFQQLRRAAEKGRATDIEFLEPGDRLKAHFFRFANQIPLNKSTPDILVNVLEYWQIDKGEKITKFSRITDIPITERNVFKLIRAGRARWKIDYADIPIMRSGAERPLFHHAQEGEAGKCLFSTGSACIFLSDWSL